MVRTLSANQQASKVALVSLGKLFSSLSCPYEVFAAKLIIPHRSLMR